MSLSNDNGKVRFNPVQCTEEMLNQLAPTPGYLYLTTDTKKIYLGTNEQKIPMCASSGFFYGTKEIEYDDSGIAPDPNVKFFFEEIEGDEIPEVDDLILNVDGCFYRIKAVSVDTQEIDTTRLTLQGTGGGGGGGGGGGSASFSIAIMGGVAKVYSSAETAMNVAFKGYYNGVEENRISQVSFTLKNADEPFYTHVEEMAFNQEQNIDLIAFKNLFTANRTTVTIKVYDLYGNERSTNFTVQVVDLSLTAVEDSLFSTLETSYQYSCKLAGATSGVSNKKIIYYFYNEKDLNTVVYQQERELAVADQGALQTTLNLSGLPHGSYVLKVRAQASITGSTTVLYSNILTHKIARFDAANGTPLLLIITPEVTEQYTNIPMDYLVATGDSSKTYTLEIRLNGELKTDLTVTSNEFNSYNLYFEEKGTYNLVCKVKELGIEATAQLNIVEYTGELPVIDPTLDELMLYLNPKGKSNDATDRDTWTDYNGKYTANVSGLHYGASDGWLMDENGVSYLKMISGASFSMPSFKPFAYDPTVKTSASYTGNGMTIELDFEISGVLDYGSQIIKCLSYDQDGVIQVGFAITGETIKFYNSRLNDSINDSGEKIGSLMSLNIFEGKRIRVSFVIEPNPKTTNGFPMCYAYINGILSGAVIYAIDDAFKDSTWEPATLKIDSTDAQVKIYGVRFYSSALSDRVILNNYTASLPTLAERQARYDTNNVFNAAGEVDYLMVSAEDYNLQIPYMKLTGGWATEAKSKWQLKPQASANVGLPTTKKDYRMVDVEVIYPENDYFKDYENYKFVNEFASGNTMDKAYGEKPSNGGAIMYAQGTSSLEYPTKNLRLRFKKEDYWYTVRPDITPVEIICMKADYMDSSGSHNTGTANLVDDVYTSIGIETPGQEHFEEDGKTIVTCIKGHPCLIFYSETGETGTYKYIGKYNLNLDKATPEPFGFNHDDTDFGYLATGDEYYQVQYDDEGDVFVGQLNPTGGGDYVAGQTEVKTTVQDGEKVNSIHCFEFLDNAVEVCNFLGKKKADGTSRYSYEETWYNTFTNSDGDQVPGWTLGFESRYPEDRIGYHDADMLYPLASWINKLYLKRVEEEAAGLTPTDVIYEYNYTLAVEYLADTEYFILEDGEYVNAYPTQDTFKQDTYYTRTVASSRFKMESLERFKREYQCYLDKDFLLTYYLLTDCLLMIDSRVKNMMIATWGKKSGSYVDYTTGETVETNNYIFYPIFYDMDTMLGIDNTGVFRFSYDSEDTDTSIFNGDEILWQFVRDALSAELGPHYTTMEGGLVTANGLLPYFNLNQANMANEAFYNGDAVYKYINPARYGYYDHLYDKEIEPGAAPYLYAAQGDRSLMREWFITNRMNFQRGKHNSNQYQNSDRIVFRWYFPTGTESDAKLVNSIAAVPPSETFNFTSLKTGYSGVKLGANGNVYNARFNGEETKAISLPEASAANGTEAYLLGLSNLTDLGDLSTKYMQKFIIESNDVRLKTLTLGNPHKDYYNPYWNPTSGGTAQLIVLSGCHYLENFNLQNCSSYNNTLDFSQCLAIKRVLLTGSSTSNITLPENGLLEELRLPSTITNLKIISHPYLTDEGFSFGSYEYGADNLIGENGSYINDFSGLAALWIENTPIDTYKIVTGANKLAEYYLPNINWEITEDNAQYCPRLADEVILDGSVTYYYYTNELGYYVYEGTEYPETGVLFEKVNILNANNEVVAIPILDYLYTQSPLKVVNKADAITGTITINIAGATANEIAVYQKYNAMFPNITIKYGDDMGDVAKAPKINFYRAGLVRKYGIEPTYEDFDIASLEPYYTVLTDGSTTLADVTYNTGNFTNPVMSSTNEKTYNLSGEWVDFNADGGYTKYYQDTITSSTDYAGKQFSDYVPTKDMDLVPIFDEYTRYYDVIFYNYDGHAVYELNSYYQYNQLIDDTGTSLNAVVDYLYRDDSELGEHERYAFKGWISETDYLNQTVNPVIYDLTTTRVTSNMKLYAYFVIEDARYVPSDTKLFTFEDVTIDGEAGYAISINQRFRIEEYVSEGETVNTSILQGKITLPDTYKGKNVLQILDFTESKWITKIYFLNPTTCKYKIIGNISLNGLSGFGMENKQAGNGSSLVYIDIPATVHSIGYYAFAGCRNMLIANNALPTGLTKVGAHAFENCVSAAITEIPSGVTHLESGCFYGCSAMQISTLKSGLTIANMAFGYACNSVTTLTLESGITIEDVSFAMFGPFYSGYQSLQSVINQSGYTTDELISFGLPSDITYGEEV